MRLTLTSVWCMSIANAGKSCLMVSVCGGGSLLRHRFTITHVTLRKNEIGISGLMKVNNG